MAARLPTPSGVIGVRLGHDLGVADIYGCGFQFGYSGGAPSSADLAVISSEISTAYGTHLASLLSADYALVEVTCRDLANPSTVPGVWSGSVAGTRSGNTNDAGVALCLSFLPDRAYRGSRPKSFFPWGVNADQSTSQQWSSAIRTAALTAWGAYQENLADISHGTTDLTVQQAVSYIKPPYTLVPNPTNPGRGRSVGTLRDPPLVMSIISTVANPKIASQRKRLGKPF